MGAGSSFFRPSSALFTLPLGSPSFGGQLEQQRFDIGIDQMRGDLRAHDAGAEHCDFTDV